MDSLVAWLADTHITISVEPLHALDLEIRELSTKTAELEALWKELSLQSKTPYVKRALEKN